MNIYLSEPRVKREEKFDILNWWMDNSSRYNILSNITLYILAIQVSTVASKFAFSTSGRIDPFRYTLAPTTVEALVLGYVLMKSMLIFLNIWKMFLPSKTVRTILIIYTCLYFIIVNYDFIIIMNFFFCRL